VNVSTKMNDEGGSIVAAQLLLESRLVTQDVQVILWLTLTLLGPSSRPREKHSGEDKYSGYLQQLACFLIHHFFGFTLSNLGPRP